MDKFEDPCYTSLRNINQIEEEFAKHGIIPPEVAREAVSSFQQNGMYKVNMLELSLLEIESTLIDIKFKTTCLMAGTGSLVLSALGGLFVDPTLFLGYGAAPLSLYVGNRYGPERVRNSWRKRDSKILSNLIINHDIVNGSELINRGELDKVMNVPLENGIVSIRWDDKNGHYQITGNDRTVTTTLPPGKVENLGYRPSEEGTIIFMARQLGYAYHEELEPKTEQL